MTMPHLMNCSHQGDGWCLLCVGGLQAERDKETGVSDKPRLYIPDGLVCIYAQLLPRIREAGEKLGYAIALHGSMRRDFDLLAVPWVEDAAPAEELVKMVAENVGGFVIGDLATRGGLEGPTVQPHGRRSWNICWGGKPFIDLSVMPRVTDR